MHNTNIFTSYEDIILWLFDAKGNGENLPAQFSWELMEGCNMSQGAHYILEQIWLIGRLQEIMVDHDAFGGNLYPWMAIVKKKKKVQ